MKSKPPHTSILPGSAKISDSFYFFRPPIAFTFSALRPLLLSRVRQPCARPGNWARLSWTSHGQRRRASLRGQVPVQRTFLSRSVASITPEDAFLQRSRPALRLAHRYIHRPDPDSQLLGESHAGQNISHTQNFHAGALADLPPGISTIRVDIPSRVFYGAARAAIGRRIRSSASASFRQALLAGLRTRC